MHSPIKIENVKKSLDNQDILQGISFSVERGDIFGFLGPNGAGKTTTIRIILGLYQADSGRASILGQDVGRNESRRHVGFLLERDGLYDSMSAEANLAYYLKIYEKPVNEQQIKRVLGLVGLADRAKDKAGTYSKGMRQRLALARALVHDPDVLILDEPTSGVDSSAQIEIRQIMLNVVRQEHKTIFLSSHNLDEVERICNRIALLHKGQIKLYGQLSALRQQMGKDRVVVQTKHILPDIGFQRIKDIPQLGLQEKDEKRLLFMPAPQAKIADIVNALSKEGVEVEGVMKSEPSLEDMYSAIVREG